MAKERASVAEALHRRRTRRNPDAGIEKMAASGWTQYTETQIREILELSKMGMQAADLARRYNVPVVVIHVWQTKYGANSGETDASRLQRLHSEIQKLHQLIDELTVEHDELEAKLAATKEKE